MGQLQNRPNFGSCTVPTLGAKLPVVQGSRQGPGTRDQDTGRHFLAYRNTFEFSLHDVFDGPPHHSIAEIVEILATKNNKK